MRRSTGVRARLVVAVALLAGVGQATGDRRTEAEGKGEQGLADAKDRVGDLLDRGKEQGDS